MRKDIKHRFLFILCLNVLVMVLGASAVAISAYDFHIFIDIDGSDYYYNEIYSMYNQGAINGYPDGEFKPQNSVTKAEVLTMLFRLAGTELDESNIDEWYGDVWQKALNLKLVYKNTSPDSYATREDIGKYIMGIYKLDISELYVRNVFEDTNNAIPNMMYQKGIFVGIPTDTGVIYAPKRNIIRGDLCIVLYRLNKLIDSPYTDYIEIGDYVVHSNPNSYEDLKRIVMALGESGETSIEVPYYRDLRNDSYYIGIRRQIITAFKECFEKYPQYFSFSNSLKIVREYNAYYEGKLILKLSSKRFDDDEILEMREKFDTECIKIVDKLRQSGKLTDSMSEYDRAKILFEYVAYNVKYDDTEQDNSFTGYGAVIDSLAVCQGYTAFFHKLCDIEDIETEGVAGYIIETGESHVWTKIKLDGNWVFCDVTFSDPLPDVIGFCDLSYFAKTYEEIMLDRTL